MAEHIWIRPEWRAEIDRVLALPRYRPVVAAGPSTVHRFARGLLAERALIHYLLLLEDGAATWISAGDEHPDTDRHKIAGDILWCGREIDVKLIGPRVEQLYVKRGAAHLDHVFLSWVTSDKTLQVLGALPRHQPETFLAAQPLRDATTNRTYTSTWSGHTVNGWVIPRSRLQPLKQLLAT